MTHGRDMTHMTKRFSLKATLTWMKYGLPVDFWSLSVMPRPLVIIKVLYDTRWTQKKTIWKWFSTSWFFGLPSVIEHLDFDQWSGHDTLKGLKNPLDGHISLRSKWLLRELFGQVWHVPTVGHNEGTLWHLDQIILWNFFVLKTTL